MKHLHSFFILCLALFITSCMHQSAQVDNENIKLAVTANHETDVIHAKEGEDAADDPAIWVNPLNIEKSTIIGTNKLGGLSVYQLDGKELFYYPIGNVNNADVLYDFPLDTGFIDIAGGSNRTSNSISLLEINKNDGSLSPIEARIIKSGVSIVYGFCFYKSPVSGKFYAFVNSKDGAAEQWELFENNGQVDAKLVRSFDVGGQVEGMVADMETAMLYVGEEGGGIWKYGAEPENADKRHRLLMSDQNNPAIKFDIEGLSIYYAADGKGYLIASSQGNYTYAVFEREGDNKYLFSFKITDGLYDGAEETDGLDVLNIPLGKEYPFGIFVVQDGFNKDADGQAVAQNFKMLSWEKIAHLVQPPLIIDTNYRIR